MDDVEAVARVIVELKGESADSIVSRFNGSGWDPHGPLWKAEGIEFAVAVIETLKSRGWTPPSEGKM